jgi:hypothetical protein
MPELRALAGSLPDGDPGVFAHLGEEVQLLPAGGGRLMSTDITTTLEERGKRYGKFTGHARITQELKQLISQHSPSMAPDQQEALDMICHKIGRILNGDPDYADSWHDIAGYAQLVADRLNGVER